MSERPSISIERVDDVPVIWAHLQAMGIIAEIDAHFDTHGNWDATLTLGETIGVWMTYMLSEGDHRMNTVEAWVAGLATTWQHLLGRDVDPKALCDDRLARVLRYLARDRVWAAFEAALGERLVRVYALPERPVRVDMSTVSVHADAEGLVPFGFSQAHRPDLPQVKVGMATLDPLGMPLATPVVAGNRADDPLYVPLVEQARQVVGGGRLYVGDSKMAALATRAFLHHQGDVYLCPAPRTVVSEETLACHVAEADEEGRVIPWRWEGEDGEVKEGKGWGSGGHLARGALGDSGEGGDPASVGPAGTTSGAGRGRAAGAECSWAGQTALSHPGGAGRPGRGHPGPIRGGGIAGGDLRM